MSPAVALLLIRVIDLIATGVELIPSMSERKKKYVTLIRSMVEEDRDPTDAEWAVILEDSDDLTDQLRRIRDAKLAAQGGTT